MNSNYLISVVDVVNHDHLSSTFCTAKSNKLFSPQGQAIDNNYDISSHANYKSTRALLYIKRIFLSLCLAQIGLADLFVSGDISR